MYRFLENFETGIPFIDNGHRRLLEDMEEAREALAAGHEDEYRRCRITSSNSMSTKKKS